MADETASLILKVDSTSASKASDDLDRLTASSAKAEAATGKLGQTSTTAGRGLKVSADATSAAARSAERLAETEDEAAQRIHKMVQASLAATEASKAHAGATEATTRATSANAAAAAAQGKSWTELARAQDAAMTNYGRFTQLARNAGTAIETLKGGALTAAAYEKAVNDLGKAVDVGAISQEEYVAALALADKAKIKDIALTEAQAVANKQVGLSSRAQAEIATAASEVLSGNFGRLRRTGAAFANQAGLLTKLMNPLALGVMAAVGATAALVAAYAKGEGETVAFNKALILTGGYAGKTASDLNELAESMTGVAGATQHMAAGVLAQVVQSGRFFGDQVHVVAAAALELQQTTGQAVGKTIDQFVKLGKDPVQGLLELNETMHFLTQATYDQVAALVERGRQDQAAEVAQKAYAAAVGQRAQDVQENLGTLQRAWNGVTGAAKAAWDAMLDIGRPTSMNDRIKAVQNRIAQVQQQLVNPATGKDWNLSDSMRDQLNARIKALQDQLHSLQNQQRAAGGFEAGQSLADRLISERIAAEQALTSGAGAPAQATLTKRLSDLAMQKAKALMGVVDPDKRQQIIDAFNAQVAEAAHQYDQAEKKLAPHTTGPHANPLSGLQSLVNSTGVSSLVVPNNKPMTEYVQTVAKLTTAFDQARAKGADLGAAEDLFAKGVAAANLKLKEQQDQIQQGNDRAFAQFKATLDQQVAAQRNAIDLQVASVGMGQKEADRMRELNELEQQRIHQVQRLQQVQAAHPEQYAELQRQIDAVNASYQDMRDTMLDGFRRLDAAQADWVNGLLAGINTIIERGQDVAGMVQGAFVDAFDGVNDALLKLVQDGKANFSDLVETIFGDLVKMELRIAESRLLTSFLGGATATSFDSNGTFFSMPNANGGVYSSPSLARYSNGVYDTPQFFTFAQGGVFAEAGPEAIMPLSRGPDGKLGVRSERTAGGNVYVNLEVKGGDGNAKVTQSRSTDGKGNQFIKLVVDQAVGEVDKRVLRGGSTSQAIQQAFGVNRRGIPVGS